MRMLLFFPLAYEVNLARGWCEATCSITSCNFYPQVLAIFLRATQNKPYLPSIPQAFKYLESCCVIEKRVKVENSVVPCDCQGWNTEKNRQELQGDSSHGGNYLSKQRVSESTVFAFGGNGFLSLECPSRDGRL